MYYQIELTHKVPTPMNKAGMDFAVCRARSAEAAVAQLLPEMRSCVLLVQEHSTLRGCYPNPSGILRERAL